MMNKGERIGAKDQQIIIQAVTETRTTSGQVTQSWAEYATVWAAVKYSLTHSDEQVRADRQTAYQLVQFTTAYDPNITEKHRVSYNGVIYEITGISITPDRYDMTLETEKRI